MQEQSAFWSYQHDQFGRGMFRGEILAFHTHHLQLTLCHRSPGIFIRGSAPPGTTIFGFPVGNNQPLYYQGQVMKQSQIIALDHHGEIELQTPAPSSILCIAVSSSLLEEYCLALTGLPFRALSHQNCLQMTDQNYQTCTRQLISLLRLLYAKKNPIQENEEQIIEDESIKTLLRGIIRLQPPASRPDRISLAGRAEKYIHDNLKKNLSIKTICRFIGTSERSLRMGFRERYGVSPKSFIQMMRLNGARKELLADNPVTETALSWGFGHLGRFSEQYRAMFGELPSETKRKAAARLVSFY